MPLMKFTQSKYSLQALKGTACINHFRDKYWLRSNYIFLTAREAIYIKKIMIDSDRGPLLYLLLSSISRMFYCLFEKCRLYIRQPPLSPEDEPEWFEYKIKETNMFTVDKYQQVRLLIAYIAAISKLLAVPKLIF